MTGSEPPAGVREPVADLAAWPPAGDHPSKWAEVDVVALRDNAAVLAALVGPGCAVMAMVKANGYGHGAVLTARAALAGGARWLGVSSPEEALQLREAGLDAPLLVVGWSHPATLPDLVRRGVDVTAWDDATVAAAVSAAAAAGRRARVHIKVDTGMGRLGARPEAVPALLDGLTREREVELAGVFTHLADADGDDPQPTLEQQRRFEPVVALARRIAPAAVVHAANSAGTLRFPALRLDLVRIGIALYGYPPAGCPAPSGLRPALSVAARVTQVKTVLPGETVGYGRTWTAVRETRVATVAAGYGDGIRRLRSNGGSAVVGGVRCPLLGRVSMDQVTVDVSAVPEVAPGDEAFLLGGRGEPGTAGHLGADEVAQVEGTISYEVLCAVSARVPRVAVGA